MKKQHRSSLALIAICVLGLWSAACAVSREGTGPEVATRAPATTRPPHADEVIGLEEDMRAAATVPAAPTTTEAPTTTTTEPTEPDTPVPNEPTEPTEPTDTTDTTATPTTEAPKGGDDCGGPQTLRVHIQGSDGRAISGQISADYKRNGQKVDGDGNAIPNDQYSQTIWLTGEDGTKDVCVRDVPDAQVFLEVYPKDYVDGAFTHRSSRYGSVMWHGVWAGPGQGVFLSVPLACRAEGKGITGTINVDATVNGAARPLRRLVAWSRTSGSTRVTPGFSVADSQQYGTPEVKRLEQVAADQEYFVQLQTDDGRIATLEPVPVSSCQDTKVEVAITQKGCEVRIAGGDAKPCRLPNAPVG